MIVLTCNECNSTKLTRYDGKMTDKGHDWFTCKDCKKNFPMSLAGYTEESDMY